MAETSPEHLFFAQEQNLRTKDMSRLFMPVTL
jgi:hypothetical protein